MPLQHIALYVAFGILPSLAWLFYYLQKDLHPEPKRMIIKIFILGALITIPTLLAQIGLMKLLTMAKLTGFLQIPPLLTNILVWFFVVALTEEVFKYVVIRFSIMKSAELDEPLDIMLYMVVAALGFAAAENILYLFSPITTGLSFGAVVKTTIIISFIRFIGATFLHTLCSALVGYCLALASVKMRHGKRLVVLGLVLATCLHGLYDFSIMTLVGPWNILFPMATIGLLAAFIVYDFDEIKKVKSICKI